MGVPWGRLASPRRYQGTLATALQREKCGYFTSLARAEGISSIMLLPEIANLGSSISTSINSPQELIFNSSYPE